ncbi:MAG: hypothetical protein Q9223_007896, partial [Gallowayella weberi]
MSRKRADTCSGTFPTTTAATVSLKRRAESLPPDGPAPKQPKQTHHFWTASEDETVYARRLRLEAKARLLGKKDQEARQSLKGYADLAASSQGGMANVTGVACYRNSLLQAILHTPALSTWLLAPKACTVSKGACVSCDLHSIAKSYWSKTLTAAQLKSTQSIYQNMGWDRGGPSQQDPDEQYRWMLSRMEFEMPTRPSRPFKEAQELRLISTLRCNTCGARSKQATSEASISLVVLPKIQGGDLKAYISRYMEESLEWRCERCQVSAPDNRRSLALQSSPEVLLVQLKCFDDYGRKVSVRGLDYESELDLNDFRAPSNKVHSVYALHAIVAHAGDCGGGHYICSA